MNNITLANIAYTIATKYKTLYVTGGQGQRLTEDNKRMFLERYANNRERRSEAIMSASADTWAFDCNGLIKAIINGWTGDPSKPRGGAVYDKVIKDITCEAMIAECADVSTDFNKVDIGELLYMAGHVGLCVSVSPLLAVEATAKWVGKVQVTSINCYVKGYERRDWQKHGKMSKYIEYHEPYIMVKTIDLKRGSRGSYVKTIQTLLQTYGAGEIDGRYGPATETAVKAFQATHKDLDGVALEIDGKTGPLTWASILRGD